MRHLRIWYLIDSYDGPYSGTEKQLQLLISHMASLGHAVSLIVLRHTEYTRASTKFPCSVTSLDIQSLASLDGLRRIVQFGAVVRRQRPDIIHCFFNDTAIIVPPFAKTKGNLVFSSRRDMGYWHTRANMLALRFSNRLVDGIICNSHAVARMVAEKEHAPQRKLFVIYNGIEDASGTPTAHSDSPARDGKINICLVANLRPIKRIEDLIRAARSVVSQVPDSRFWIVGDSMDAIYERFLIELIRDLDLHDTVRLLGQAVAPAAIVRDCQIGVLTSESEGLSNTILEYMNHGLAVMCSNVGGNSELIEHRKNGLLYPCGNIDELAKGLLELCTDGIFRKKLANAARRRSQDFTIEANIEAHLHAYGASPIS